MKRVLVLLLIASGFLQAAEPVRVRIVAANLTSGTRQSYSPDNGNHSNLEGAGARILKALNPDIVLIQEFNTTMPVRQWINSTLGQEFQFAREEDPGIPNGIISRFPIIESGEWDDARLDNRDFVWAKIALPDGTKLWAVSVHLYSQKSTTRAAQAAALVSFLREKVQPGERIVVGGDFNTRALSEDCLREFANLLTVPEIPPSDQLGNGNTNEKRSRPYDWVLVDAKTEAAEMPVEIAGNAFADGFVFDSRVFEPSQLPPPVQPGDSGVNGMQHMAVVRDFAVGK